MMRLLVIVDVCGIFVKTRLVSSENNLLEVMRPILVAEIIICGLFLFLAEYNMENIFILLLSFHFRTQSLYKL